VSLTRLQPAHTPTLLYAVLIALAALGVYHLFHRRG
jgi:hypothetical protein